MPDEQSNEPPINEEDMSDDEYFSRAWPLTVERMMENLHRLVSMQRPQLRPLRHHFIWEAGLRAQAEDMLNRMLMPNRRRPARLEAHPQFTTELFVTFGRLSKENRVITQDNMVAEIGSHYGFTTRQSLRSWMLDAGIEWNSGKPYLKEGK